MLLPRNVRELMHAEQERFVRVYKEVLRDMNKIMTERGKDRDNETPIYVRRPPESNRSLAEGKLLRVQSLLSKLDTEDPDLPDLRKIVEECIDISNYAIFIAVTCTIVLNEEDSESFKADYTSGIVTLPETAVTAIRIALADGASITEITSHYTISTEALEHIGAGDYYKWLAKEKS